MFSMAATIYLSSCSVPPVFFRLPLKLLTFRPFSHPLGVPLFLSSAARPTPPFRYLSRLFSPAPVPLPFAKCPQLPLDSLFLPPRHLFIALVVSFNRSETPSEPSKHRFQRGRSFVYVAPCTLAPATPSTDLYVFCIRHFSPAMHLMHRLPQAALPPAPTRGPFICWHLHPYRPWS